MGRCHHFVADLAGFWDLGWAGRMAAVWGWKRGKGVGREGRMRRFVLGGLAGKPALRSRAAG